MSISADIVFKLILYGVGFMAVVSISINLFTDFSKLRERIRVDQEIKLSAYNQKWVKNALLKKYHLLLDSTLKHYRIDLFSKIVLSQLFVFFALTVLLAMVIRDIRFSLSISMLFVYVFPIVGLYFLHKQRQNVIQEELVDTAILLLQEYEKNSRNMLFALKETVTQIKGKTNSVYAKTFARMHADEFMQIKAAETLAFQIGHVRGKNLATIILRGCKDGTDVTVLLEDLVEDITNFNKRVSDAQTEARETALIGFLPIPMLIILYFVNELWLLPDGGTFYYQFQTKEGLKSFLISLALGVIGIGLGLLVRKPKKG